MPRRCDTTAPRAHARHNGATPSHPPCRVQTAPPVTSTSSAKPVPGQRTTTPNGSSSTRIGGVIGAEGGGLRTSGRPRARGGLRGRRSALGHLGVKRANDAPRGPGYQGRKRAVSGTLALAPQCHHPKHGGVAVPATAPPFKCPTHAPARAIRGELPALPLRAPSWADGLEGTPTHPKARNGPQRGRGGEAGGLAGHVFGPG